MCSEPIARSWQALERAKLGETGGPARRRGWSGPAAMDRDSEMSTKRRASRGPYGGHRRGEICRPLHRALRDYVFDWERMWPSRANRSLPPVRPRSDPVHLSACRGGTTQTRSGAHARRRQERALALLLLGFDGGLQGDGGDLQPVQAVRLPVRVGHLVHRRSTRVAGCWWTTKRSALSGWGCATSRRGSWSKGSRCWGSRRQKRCDLSRAGPYPLNGTSVTARVAGRREDRKGATAKWNSTARQRSSPAGPRLAGHVSPAGRAGRPGGRGRRPRGQGHATGQRDRRHVRPTDVTNTEKVIAAVDKRRWRWRRSSGW